MRLADKLATWIAHKLCDRSALEYAEPGYEAKRGIIFFADWNRNKRLQTVLERLGYDTEWSDEWTFCADCDRALRDMPTSYMWERYAIKMLGNTVCVDCAKTQMDDVFFLYENNPWQWSWQWLPSYFDLAEYGYVMVVGGLENGFHPGQTDNPISEYRKHRRQWDSLIVQITGTSQFYVTFSLWGKKHEG